MTPDLLWLRQPQSNVLEALDPVFIFYTLEKDSAISERNLYDSFENGQSIPINFILDKSKSKIDSLRR